MRTSLFLLVVVGLAACAPPVDRSHRPFNATGELIALSGGDGGAKNACFTCHGIEGQGDGVSTPRLAGLDAGYLHKQMEDYAAGLRAHDVMTGIARKLEGDDRRAVAAWYAAMPPTDRMVAASPAPAVYTEGDPGRGLVPCATCHGLKGEGAGAGNPALAGQPAAYIVDQLNRWRALDRRNDPRGVMAGAAAPLTSAEIQAIAAWLTQQSPSPAPSVDAAMASAAETAAAELATSRGTRRPGR